MGVQGMLLALAIVLLGLLGGAVILACGQALLAIVVGCLAVAIALFAWWVAAGGAR